MRTPSQTMIPAVWLARVVCTSTPASCHIAYNTCIFEWVSTFLFGTIIPVPCRLIFLHCTIAYSCFSKLKNHQADQTLQFWKLVKLAYLNAWAATHLNIQHGRGNELIPTFIQKLLARALLWLIYHKLVAKLNSKRKILHKFNSKKKYVKDLLQKRNVFKDLFQKEET